MENLQLQIECMYCHNNFNFIVKKDDFKEFKTGNKNIQDVFPYLSINGRELLLSRMCESCFDKVFKG